VQLGIGLPTHFGNLVERDAVLDWARRAEAAGFAALTVHDRPASDTWEPLATLATLATATERIRLVTTAIILPTRDEALLAKQAAVVDRMSDGRLDLGVGVGLRPDDFELFGRPFAGRGRTFVRQLERLSRLWAEAIASAESGTAMGPAPAQRPRPRLWVGGYSPAAPGRAILHGDGYIFGAPGLAAMTDRTPRIKAAAKEAGRPDFPVAGLAYVLLSTSRAEIDEAERLLTRYYRTLSKPFRELVAIGDDDAIAATIDGYRAAGLDVLHLLPVSRSAEQVDRLARVAALAA
jgi:alkanesulfonate monooxygenase SsuD/methylene tetrahydromethanopterin reductase-like flavin-dependent oxidoreductase (luciferase family)